MIGDEVVFLEEVASTNSYLMEKISLGKVKEGTLIWTHKQTAGKGLDKNVWESEPGKNLTFSFVLYPNFLPAYRQFMLNQAISLAVFDLIKSELPGSKDVKIKWPNDIYFGNRKVAGILIQNGIKGERFDFSVIGIGINVNQESFSAAIPNPVSLKLLTGKDYILDSFLNRVIQCLQSRVDLLVRGYYDRLEQDYLENLYQYNQDHEYIYKGKKITARIAGTTRYGQLILEVPSGEKLECDLKEVKFI